MYHLAHPRPVSWKSLFLPVCEKLGIPPASYAMWLHRLKMSAEWFGDVSADREVELTKLNPALKLMDFFDGAATKQSDGASIDEEHHAGGSVKIKAEKRVEVNGTTESKGAVHEAFGLPALSVAEAEKVAPSLSPANLPQLTSEDAMRWIKYWKSIGYL